jgi:penicillin-insensitive murein endopeptidase
MMFGAREYFHINKGESQSIGSVRNGALRNGYLLPYKAANFDYFSPLSYFLLDNGYVHSNVHKTMMDAFEILASKTPDRYYSLMECSNQNGGPILVHRTHMNGMSVDFMAPKLRNGKQNRFWDNIGIWHYALAFDADGRLLFDKKTVIDFESIAQAILAIDDAAKNHGLRIRKVIWKINLKDDLFATKGGQELLNRKIYFVRNMPDIVDMVHDDHFHIDFEKI